PHPDGPLGPARPRARPLPPHRPDAPAPFPDPPEERMTAAGEPSPPTTPGPTDSTSIPIHLRPARAADVSALVPLLLRLKRLNEEFDPLLRVRDDAESQAREILKATINDPKAVLLAAEGVGPDKDKVVGFVNAVLRERAFYAP